jgi:hypothetical protein
MILLTYRMLSSVLALLAVAALLGKGTREQKISAGVLLVPLVLRALLVK